MKALDLAAEIKNILLDNAKTSGLKQKKVPLKEQRQSDPWFDAECKNAKKTLNLLSKKLRKTPGDQTIREQLFQEKRKLKKIILAKKRRYKKTSYLN